MKNAEEMVKEKGSNLISVTPDTTIHDALKIMTDHLIGSILIEDNGKIKGIWTERDLMRNTLTAGFDPSTMKISEVMTTGLISAPHTDNVFQLKDKFLGKHIRHLLIQKDNNYIGLLSIGDVIKASLQAKDEELKNLNAICSWDYYENWQKWKKKK